MTNTLEISGLSRPLVPFVGICLIGFALATGAWAADEPSAHEDHAGHHQLTAEQLAELRAKIPLYDRYTDEQIVAGMSRMQNLGGTLSAAGMAGDVGVLALAHGFKEPGNQQFKDAFAETIEIYPTTYGLGMAMMSSDHIQQAVDSLETAGAKRIIVIPVTTADNTTLVRQWQYIFDAREESAYLDVPRVTTNTEIIWTPTPTAHPIMAEIMLDFARELSDDPANELVVIMGHGPQDAADNEKELAILARHAEYLKTAGGFSDVRFANVQDDAPPEIRAANVEKARSWMGNARDEGKNVIIVTTVLTQSGVMGRLQRDTDGFDARFADKGLMLHPRFPDWIEISIDEALAAAGGLSP